MSTVQRVLVTTSDGTTTVPPDGYGGLARLAWGMAVELSLLGVETHLCAPRVDAARASRDRPIIVHPWPPGEALIADMQVVHTTDPNTSCALAGAVEKFKDVLFVCEQNAPWLAGPRAPNVRHVVFRSDRLPQFHPEEVWLCDQVLLRDEVGPPLPSRGAIVWMGRIHPDKNPEAMQMLAHRCADREFVVVGPAHAPEPVWPSNVRRVASLGGSAKAELLRSAAAFVYTVAPDWIGAGEQVLTEAMACGLPILAQSFSFGCPAGRLIREGVNGFRRADPAELAGLVQAAVSLDRESVFHEFGRALAPPQVAARRLEMFEGAVRALSGKGPLIAIPRASPPPPGPPGVDAAAPHETQDHLEGALGALENLDWHAAIGHCLAGRKTSPTSEGAFRFELLLGRALLGAGREQVRNGDLDAARRTFGLGTRLLMERVRALPPLAAMHAYARWIDLDCEYNAQEAASALHHLWRFLVLHDERIKAHGLLKAVPWMLQDHPLVLEMERWGGRIEPHLVSQRTYEAFYSREHVADPIAVPTDPARWLPRAHDAVALVSKVGGRGRVLEVGCYDGPVGFPVLLSHPQVDYTGVDPNAEALRRFRASLDGAGCSADLRGELPARGVEYDGLLLTEVLEHVADPVAFLSLVFGYLAEGGLCLITTPWGSYEQGRPIVDAFSPDAFGHLWSITPRDLLAWLDEVGVRCQRLWRQDPGTGRGVGLHAIIEKRAPHSTRLAFYDPTRAAGLDELIHAIAPLARIEVFRPVPHPAVIDEVRVLPLVQARTSRSPLVAVDTWSSGAKALLWTGTRDLPLAEQDIPVLVSAADLEEKARQAGARSVLRMPDWGTAVSPPALLGSLVAAADP